MLRKKLIVIVGPNAAGKTNLSITLAKKHHGEIVSADSRQVYTGLDIGSGKVTKKETKGVPHHLLDVASPKQRFTVSQYQKQTAKAIAQIHKKGKLPFLVGGTGFYVQTVADGLVIPAVKPNPLLRKKLEKKTAPELFHLLQKHDPARAATIEKDNKRRLVRALEIVLQTGKPVPKLEKNPPPYDILMLGVTHAPKKLQERIRIRLLNRLKHGMIAEVKQLRRSGVSWKRLEELGLEYRYCALYLQNKLTREEMIEQLEKAIWQFAKRQMTWFKRDKRIHWIRTAQDAEKHIKRFLE